MMSRFRLLVLLLPALVLLVPVLSTARVPLSQSTVPSLDRHLPARVERVYAVLVKAFSPKRAMDIVTLMSRSWRLPGNPAFETSEDLIAKRLSDAGFQMTAPGSETAGRQAGSDRAARRDGVSLRMWYEEFPLSTPAWEPVAAKLTLLDARDNVATADDAGGLLLDMARPLDRVSLCINSF